MATFSVDPHRHLPEGFELEAARVGPRVQHQIFVADWYQRKNEDLAIVTLRTRFKDTFPSLSCKLLKFFTDVHQVRVTEIQPCALGHAYVRFGSSVERERFLGPVFKYEKYEFIVSKHDEAMNSRSIDLDREAWFMMVGYPEDLRNDAGLARAVSTFGILIDWQKTNVLARVVVKVFLKVDADIPHTVLVDAGVPGKGRSWTVYVFRLKKKSAGTVVLNTAGQSSLPRVEYSAQTGFGSSSGHCYESEGVLQASMEKTMVNEAQLKITAFSGTELNVNVMNVKIGHISVGVDQVIDKDPGSSVALVGSASPTPGGSCMESNKNLIQVRGRHTDGHSAGQGKEFVGSSANPFGVPGPQLSMKSLKPTSAHIAVSADQEMNKNADKRLALIGFASDTEGGTSMEPNANLVNEPDTSQGRESGKRLRSNQEHRRMQPTTATLNGTSSEDSDDVIEIPKPASSSRKKRRAKKHRQPMDDVRYLRRSKRLAGREHSREDRASPEPVPLAVIMPPSRI